MTSTFLGPGRAWGGVTLGAGLNFGARGGVKLSSSRFVPGSLFILWNIGLLSMLCQQLTGHAKRTCSELTQRPHKGHPTSRNLGFDQARGSVILDSRTRFS